MHTVHESVTVSNSTFFNNKANVGGVIWSRGKSFKIDNSSLDNNSADSHGGIMFTVQCSTDIAHSTFHNSFGSLYTFNGNLTFTGQSKFENCVESSNKTAATVFALQEGGAITSFHSIVYFNGKINLVNNQARQGGAILAIESMIIIRRGTTTIANNTATDTYGGGISLQQSVFEIRGSCSISDNYAMEESMPRVQLLLYTAKKGLLSSKTITQKKEVEYT